MDLVDYMFFVCVRKYTIAYYFTGTNDGFTWMWENKILEKFNHYAKEISGYDILVKIFLEIIDEHELLYFFIEDTLNYETKYWATKVK